MAIYLLYILTFLNVNTQPATAVVTEASEITWYTWEEAHEKNKTAPKKIFIDLYTDWCGWCKKMDKTTFTDPAVVEVLNRDFYAVKFNAEQEQSIKFNEQTYEFIKSGRKGVHQLAYALLDGRLGYPAFVTLDESFARIMISPGYKQSPQLLKELTFAKEEHYKTKSFEDFEKEATGE